MLKKIQNFNELVMFEHTIFSASFILISMVVSSLQADGSVWMGWSTFFLCVVALVSARNFAMGFNRLLDRDIDALNPRTTNRPSVDGRVGFVALSVFCGVNAIIFVLVSYYINTLAFMLSLPFLVILGGYSVMKRISSLAHLVLGISLGLAPIAGCIAVLGSLEWWCVALSVAVMFWVAGFDLLYSLQDREFDIKHNLYSIPSRFGVQNTLYLSRLFHLCAVIFWGIFIYQTQILGVISCVGLVVCAIMLIYEQYLVHRDFVNIPKAFFATNGYLGFVFFVFVAFDGVWHYGL